MSNALWCDQGGHAFSEKDPNRQHFTQTKTVNVRAGDRYGSDIYQERKEVTDELDVCGPCWKKQSLFLEGGQASSPEAPTQTQD